MTARIATLLLLFIIPIAGFCQVRAIDLYQYNYTSISPAFAGVDGTKISAMGNVLLGKTTYNFYNAFAGFETKLGNYGMGITGCVYNDGWYAMRYVSVPINYQWKLNDKRTLVFGIRPSFEQASHGYQAPGGPSQFYPDNFIDGWNYKSAFNSSVAALYRGDKFYAGFSVDNVLHTKLFPAPEFTAPQYNIIVGKDFYIDQLLNSEHSIYAMVIDRYSWHVDLNNNLVIGKTIVLGMSVMVTDTVYPKFNGGWRFGKLGQAIVSLYSASNSSTYKRFSGQMMLQFNLRGKEGV